MQPLCKVEIFWFIFKDEKTEAQGVESDLSKA